MEEGRLEVNHIHRRRMADLRRRLKWSPGLKATHEAKLDVEDGGGGNEWHEEISYGVS